MQVLDLSRVSLILTVVLSSRKLRRKSAEAAGDLQASGRPLEVFRLPVLCGRETEFAPGPRGVAGPH